VPRCANSGADLAAAGEHTLALPGCHVALASGIEIQNLTHVEIVGQASSDDSTALPMLSGGHKNRIFKVVGSLTLKNLVLRRGRTGECTCRWILNSEEEEGTYRGSISTGGFGPTCEEDVLRPYDFDNDNWPGGGDNSLPGDDFAQMYDNCFGGLVYVGDWLYGFDKVSEELWPNVAGWPANAQVKNEYELTMARNLTAHNVTFEFGLGWAGAGIFVANGGLYLIDSTVRYNMGRPAGHEGPIGEGGGISVAGQLSRLGLYSTNVYGNANFGAGGVSVRQAQYIEFDGHVRIHGNTAAQERPNNYRFDDSSRWPRTCWSDDANSTLISSWGRLPLVTDSTSSTGQTQDQCRNRVGGGKVAWPIFSGCAAGKFAPLTPRSSMGADLIGCSDNCPAGRFSGELYEPRSICAYECPAGAYCPPGSTLPTPCPGGRFGTEAGQDLVASCHACAAGKYNIGDVPAASCFSCPVGFWQASPDRSFCYFCLPGQYADAEGLLACKSCASGQFAGTPVVQTRGPIACGECKAGYYADQAGSTLCLKCPLGKYGPSPGLEICFQCPAGRLTDDEASTACRTCAESGFSPNDAQTTCIMPLYKVKSSCKDTEYLDNADPDRMNHTCRQCPAGASCTGPVDWRDVKAIFGWARCPAPSGAARGNDTARDARTGIVKAQPENFERCSFSASCLGTENKALEEGFALPANVSRNESCNDGYLHESRLCFSCSPGYSHEGGSFRCNMCPQIGSTVTVAIFGGVFGMVGLGVFLYIAIMAAKENEGHAPTDGFKMIGLNFIQILALCATFPIQWPAIFTSLFQVGGAITALGKHFINLKCLVPSYSDADVHFAQAVVSAAMLPGLLVVIAGGWKLLDMVRPRPNVGSRVRISVVATSYLLYPSICSATFSLGSCRTVCGADYLRSDLNEACYTGRHLAYLLLLFVPMVVVYVLGLPVVGLYAVWHLRRTSSPSKRGEESSGDVAVRHTATMKLRMKHLSDRRAFGMLYSMYSLDSWYWEGTSEFPVYFVVVVVVVVAAVVVIVVAVTYPLSFSPVSFVPVVGRKVVFSAIGVFGSQLGAMQVHMMSMFLLVLILSTAIMRPFNKNAKKRKRGLAFVEKWLQSLELASLSAVWLTLWAGAVFLSYPGCKAAFGSERNAEDESMDGDAEMGLETLPWCNTISVAVGVVDILVLVAIGVCFAVTSRRLKRIEDGMKQRGERIHLEHVEDAVSISQTVSSLGHRFHHSNTAAADAPPADAPPAGTSVNKYVVPVDAVKGGGGEEAPVVVAQDGAN
jgi:hypothetical protein